MCVKLLLEVIISKSFAPAEQNTFLLNMEDSLQQCQQYFTIKSLRIEYNPAFMWLSGKNNYICEVAKVPIRTFLQQWRAKASTRKTQNNTEVHLQLLHGAPPLSPNDIDYNDSNTAGGYSGPGNTLGNLLRGNNPPMDYNMMFTHVKDFFMYLPVMMTTLRESMAGFPKFAEGIRILTSKNGRLEGADCNCEKNSNEIDSRQYG